MWAQFTATLYCMDEKLDEDDLDEMEQRMGDLWSLSDKEQDSLARAGVVGAAIVLVALVLAFWGGCL